MAKTALYTVNLGGYDEFRPLHPQTSRGVDCYLVTDEPPAYPKGWKIILVPKTDDPHRQQRRLKIMFHEIEELQGYETVIYMDANLESMRHMTAILQFHKGGFTTFVHPQRDCVYAEGFACMDLEKADPDLIREQLAAYVQEGIRPRSGMYQTNVIIRSMTDEVKLFCGEWYDALRAHTHRDQLSIIAARERTGMHIDVIAHTSFNLMFRKYPHRSKMAPKIHYLTPYAPDKNIGKAYNEEVAAVGSDDDWIVLRDGDTLFPTPDWGRQIEEALMAAGDRFALIGAMTNRIGGEHQRVPGMFEEWDMREHVKKALELEKQKWAVIEETPLGVAGFFMAFRKRTWKEIKFTEMMNQARIFDTVFYKEVRKRGLRVGLMTGLYLVHLYRPLSENPRSDYSHLV